jgi:ABC-type Fe3+-hydroxamate transport system substrate-binding protein
MVEDDLGVRMTRGGPRSRIVSLVPSLTEALATVDADAIVGVTDWCTHPRALAAQRVRGTKNPDLAAIRGLRPHLVVANKEENREIDVRRLRESGVDVWVTDINSVDEAFASMQRLFAEGLGWPAPAWLPEARALWSLPGPLDGLRVSAAVWRDPWMVVGSPTFSDDVLRRLGALNPFADRVERYPRVTLAEVRSAGLDVLLLPDEPYPFTAEDGPEAMPGVPTALVSGRLLTWYGPSLIPARSHLEMAILRSRDPLA